MQGVLVGQVVEGEDTVGGDLVDGLHPFFNAGPELILPIEDGQLRRTFQRHLYGDGGTNAATADQGDLLAGHFDAVPAEVLGVAAAVGVVSHQDAVLIDDGIHGLNGLCRRGQAI